MSDVLGPIAVPDPVVIGAFPFKPEYGSGMDFEPPIAIHSFDQPGLKTEQRFVLGSGARRFRVQRSRLACDDYDRLKAHWTQAQGVYAQFPFTYQTPTAQESYTCRYENPNLTFDQLQAFLSGPMGITLLEVPVAPAPVTSVATVERFPDATFTEALRQQTQHVVPLLTITTRPLVAANPPIDIPSYAIRLSNQRITVDGTAYLPRLLSWDGIEQTLGEQSDAASFTFGDADGVFQQLANVANLHRAVVKFALYHRESGYIVEMWSGYCNPWGAGNGQFQIGASDGTFNLGLAYPGRMATRSCWKVYKGRYCPSVSAELECPKSFEACTARGVPKSFGGLVVPALAVNVKDNSTGVMGFGRSMLTSVTVRSDTIYQRAVQEVYTDIPMDVVCDVAAGRDESDFYSAIGVVGEGPIGAYSSDLLRHRLDDQPPHDPKNGGGFRGAFGHDPAEDWEYFQLASYPWTTPPNANYAAGTAFAEIRRSDEKGLQLSAVSERKMKVRVDQGIGGWAWTAPGARVWQPALSNVFWVALNVYLRGIGLRVDEGQAALVPAATMEQFFNVNQAISVAGIADMIVPKLVGEGTERQFPFRGVLKERKPLKDWLTEILNCGLGFYTFVNGKFWMGIRGNSSVLAGNAFTRANVLYKTFTAVPVQPAFNSLTVEFGDEEFDFALNNVTIYDIDYAGFIGTPESPQYNASTMSLVGVSNKSQAARLGATRLKEELGGVGLAEQRDARACRFKTTVLALQTMVGDIVSMDDPALPNGRSEGRVKRWRLNPDFSVDIETVPTTDAMYDYAAGPKPADIPADAIPPELLPSITGLGWMPNEVGPFAGDPLYPDILERSFDVWQDYTIMREGIWDAAIWVRGELPINTFVSTAQPRIVGAINAAGGTLAGGQTVYIAVTVRGADGKPATPSNLYATWIPEGQVNRKITVLLGIAPAGPWTHWDLWAGTDRRLIGWQQSGVGALPLSIDFLGPVHPMTMGLPEMAARKVRIAAKHVWHSGIAGVLVNSVTAPNKIQSNDFIASTDPWVGRDVSALADASDGSAPLWNFRVTAFDPVTGTLTVTPDCVRVGEPQNSVEAGDVLIVRSAAVTVSPDGMTITDPMWNNSVGRSQFGADGLEIGKEVGRIYRILRGKGAGQFRYINANTKLSVTVYPAWETIPDATSIGIIEDPAFTYFSESSDLDVPAPNTRQEIRLRLDNLRDRVALVGGFLVDDQGRITDEQFAVFREIYVFGQPPTVRNIGPETLDPATTEAWQVLATDQTLMVDNTVNDVEVQLAPLYVYQGRTLYIFSTGDMAANIHCYPGELLFNGSDMVTITGNGQSVRITAAGN